MKVAFILDAARSDSIKGTESFAGYGHLTRCLNLAMHFCLVQPEVNVTFFVRTNLASDLDQRIPKAFARRFVSNFLDLDLGGYSHVVMDSNLLSPMEVLSITRHAKSLNLASRGYAPCLASASLLNTCVHACLSPECIWLEAANCGPQYSLVHPLSCRPRSTKHHRIHVISGGRDDLDLVQPTLAALDSCHPQEGLDVIVHCLSTEVRQQRRDAKYRVTYAHSWPLDSDLFDPSDLVIAGVGQVAEETLSAGLRTILISGSSWHSERARELQTWFGVDWLTSDLLGLSLPKLIHRNIGETKPYRNLALFDGQGFNRVLNAIVSL